MKSNSCEKRIDKHLDERLREMRAALRQDELDVRAGESWEHAVPDEGDEECRLCNLVGAETRNGLCKTCFESVSSEEPLRGEDILSVEKKIVKRVCLSWGGPADYFDVFFDADGDITRIDYLFQDWFDGATRTLSGGDFEDAKRFFDSIGLCEQEA